MYVLTLKSYFIDQLKDLLSVEKQLLKSLPKLEKAASEKRLKKAFADHRIETAEHAERLKEALGLMEEKPIAKHCDAMAGLLQQGDALLEARAEAHVRDVALIALCRRIEHYEIAGYDAALALACKLAPVEVQMALEKTLEEEFAANELLKNIAEGGWFSRSVNEEACAHDKKMRAARAEGGSKSPLEDWTKSDLQVRASELDIGGRSTMNKQELIGAIRSSQ